MTDHMDIHALDAIDPETDDSDDALARYVDGLMTPFLEAAPGVEAGWVAFFIDYGYRSLGVTLPRMTANDVEEILVEVFPRKITTESEDDAREVIPAIRLFWNWLSRSYELPQARSVLMRLDALEHGYPEIMNDRSRWGMAKRFTTLGREAGFDMSDPEDLEAFKVAYNSSLAGANQEQRAAAQQREAASRAAAKKKSKRAMEKATRRKNRRKKK
ncbi:MAG TPA: hypothetical protein VNA69_01905 [Thermoanaerobaculia bacterium]|nr:hypothetical protein [Thermoanaerobaculia bacterium]